MLLFSSEEDLNPMAPLPKVESAFTADTSWSSSVGDGIGDFYPSQAGGGRGASMPPLAMAM